MSPRVRLVVVVSCLLFVLSCVAACMDNPPPPSGPQVTSHIASFDYPASGTYELDVLFVVDDTAAMAPYQDALTEIATTGGATFERLADGKADIRIAVASAGHTSTILERSIGFDLVPKQTFTGSLASALQPLLQVGTSNPSSSEPLATMKTALDGSSFMRPYAALGVAIISANDDASLGAPAEYAAWLKAQQTDPAQVVVGGMYLRPATRLDTFMMQFPNRSVFTALDAADHAPVFDIFGQLLKTTLGVACIDELPLDVDPDTAGDQWDCSIAAVYDGVDHTLPRCGSETIGPCWDVVIDPTICPYEGTGLFVLHGGYSWSFHPEIRGQCVVQGPK